MAIVPTAPVPAKATAPAAPAAPVQKPVLLELRHINRYRKGDRLYEKGTVYEFTPAQAVILLGETDNGKSIWKRTTAAQTKAKPVYAAPEKKIVDMTKADVPANLDEDGNPDHAPEAFEVGNDEEIAEINGMIEAGHDETGEVETV